MDRNSYSNGSSNKKKTEIALKLQLEEKRLRSFLSSLSETLPVNSNAPVPKLKEASTVRGNKSSKLSAKSYQNEIKLNCKYEKELEEILMQCQFDMELLIKSHKLEVQRLNHTIGSLIKRSVSYAKLQYTLYYAIIRKSTVIDQNLNKTSQLNASADVINNSSNEIEDLIRWKTRTINQIAEIISASTKTGCIDSKGTEKLKLILSDFHPMSSSPSSNFNNCGTKSTTKRLDLIFDTVSSESKSGDVDNSNNILTSKLSSTNISPSIPIYHETIHVNKMGSSRSNLSTSDRNKVVFQNSPLYNDKNSTIGNKTPITSDKCNKKVGKKDSMALTTDQYVDQKKRFSYYSESEKSLVRRLSSQSVGNSTSSIVKENNLHITNQAISDADSGRKSVKGINIPNNKRGNHDQISFAAIETHSFDDVSINHAKQKITTSSTIDSDDTAFLTTTSRTSNPNEDDNTLIIINSKESSSFQERHSLDEKAIEKIESVVEPVTITIQRAPPPPPPPPLPLIPQIKPPPPAVRVSIPSVPPPPPKKIESVQVEVVNFDHNINAEILSKGNNENNSVPKWSSLSYDRNETELNNNKSERNNNTESNGSVNSPVLSELNNEISECDPLIISLDERYTDHQEGIEEKDSVCEINETIEYEEVTLVSLPLPKIKPPAPPPINRNNSPHNDDIHDYQTELNIDDTLPQLVDKIEIGNLNVEASRHSFSLSTQNVIFPPVEENNEPFINIEVDNIGPEKVTSPSLTPVEVKNNIPFLSIEDTRLSPTPVFHPETSTPPLSVFDAENTKTSIIEKNEEVVPKPSPPSPDNDSTRKSFSLPEKISRLSLVLSEKVSRLSLCDDSEDASLSSLTLAEEMISRLSLTLSEVEVNTQPLSLTDEDNSIQHFIQLYNSDGDIFYIDTVNYN